jgi:uncharacterized FlaG/YvyC family protein
MTINSVSSVVYPDPASYSGSTADKPADVIHPNAGTARQTDAETKAQFEQAHKSKKPAEEIHSVNELAEKAGLELRIKVLPHTDVILVRFVEPDTGRVIREFPPEHLAEALAELRQRAAAKLDQHA